MNLTNILDDEFKSTITDYTIDGKCSKCGDCCSNILPMSLKEIVVIEKYVKKHKIKRKRLNVLTNNTQIVRCPFVDLTGKEKKCMIYPVRPNICRIFMCNSIPKTEQEYIDVYIKTKDCKKFLVDETFKEVLDANNKT